MSISRRSTSLRKNCGTMHSGKPHSPTESHTGKPPRARSHVTNSRKTDVKRFFSRAVRARIGFSPSEIQKCAHRRYWRADRFPDGQYYWKMKRTPVLAGGLTSERGFLLRRMGVKFPGVGDGLRIVTGFWLTSRFRHAVGYELNPVALKPQMSPGPGKLYSLAGIMMVQ